MDFNGTIRRNEVSRTHEPKANRVDEVRISEIARRPVSALWTLNYTTNSTTEAMNSGLRHYWRVRALDGGGEQ